MGLLRLPGAPGLAVLPTIRRPTGAGARSPSETPRDRLAPSRLYHVSLSYVTINDLVLTTWY